MPQIGLTCSTEKEKQSQLQRLADFYARSAEQAPVWQGKLKQALGQREIVCGSDQRPVTVKAAQA